jgi:hypothetical protein
MIAHIIPQNIFGDNQRRVAAAQKIADYCGQENLRNTGKQRIHG